MSQENHQIQSDDPRRIQGDTGRNFRNWQGMVSEDAQRFSSLKDRRTEPEMTIFGTATKRQKNRIVYIVGESMLKNLKIRLGGRLFNPPKRKYVLKRGESHRCKVTH